MNDQENQKNQASQPPSQTLPPPSQTPPLTPPVLPTVYKVTKNPGRVEAGKRLAEFNRQKKLNNITKEKLIDQKSGEEERPPAIHVKQKDSNLESQSITQALDYKTLGIIFVGGVGCYFAYKNITPRSSKQETKQKEHNTKHTEPNIKHVEPKEEIKNKPIHQGASDPFLMQ